MTHLPLSKDAGDFYNTDQVITVIAPGFKP